MAKAATEKPELVETLAEKIDRLGKLEGELAPWKPRIKAAEALRKEIAAAFGGKAEESATLTGSTYFAIVGPRKLQTKIRSMRSVLKAVGQKLFLEHCGYTLDNLAQDAPTAYSSLVYEERTGSRDVKTYAKAA